MPGLMLSLLYCVILFERKTLFFYQYYVAKEGAVKKSMKTKAKREEGL